MNFFPLLLSPSYTLFLPSHIHPSALSPPQNPLGQIQFFVGPEIFVSLSFLPFQFTVSLTLSSFPGLFFSLSFYTVLLLFYGFISLSLSRFLFLYKFHSFAVDFQLKRDLLKYWALPRHISNSQVHGNFSVDYRPFRSFNFSTFAQSTLFYHGVK